MPHVFAALVLLLTADNAALAVDARKVEVKRADGSLAQGTLLGLSPEQALVGTPAGVIRFAADELPRVELSGARKNPPANSAWGRAWLNDGSSVPIIAVAGPSESGELKLTLPEETGVAAVSLIVSIDAVRSLRLPQANLPQVESRAKQWADLRKRGPADDLLVTQRRAHGALDYLEGYIEAIDQDSVTFVLDGEPITAPLTKVYGVVFARASDSAALASSQPGPRVSARGGIELTAAEMALSDTGELKITTVGGLQVSLPTSAVDSIDYSAGRVAYLSDLPYESTRQRPLFGVPPALRGDAPAPAVRVDSAFWGGPLEVSNATADVSYSKGLAIRSGSEVSYRLDAPYRQLRGVVGIDPNASGPRRLRLLIEGDGKTLLDETLTTETPPLDVGISIEGVRTLRLHVDRRESLDATVHFGDARLQR